eukprot:7770377-Heterocapsa_arctica.AAC.1
MEMFGPSDDEGDVDGDDPMEGAPVEGDLDEVGPPPPQQSGPLQENAPPTPADIEPHETPLSGYNERPT